jgi:membrane protein YqaA with SNARE-associated domain
VATAGSVAGCYLVYEIARRGGEVFVRARLRAEHVERGLALFRRHGLLAIVVPSLLPPPTPLKLFLLVAGLAEVRPTTFAGAIAIGRGLRFVAIAWLARAYGVAALTFIRTKLPTISLWAGVAFAVVGVAVLLWRRRRAT